MPTQTPKSVPCPHPTDGPVLLALLIGANRSGNKDRERSAREALERIGIRVHIAKNAPALGGRKAVRRG